MDTQENSGLPSLHCALQSNLSSSRSCLLTIGAVYSAVFRGMIYICFLILIHMEKMDFLQ